MKHYETTPSCQITNLAEIYQKVFGYREDGFFVDVGSYDGITYSNVHNLALAGWKGICFEPVPEYWAKCVEVYKPYPVKVIQVAIGNKSGELYMEIAGASSSGSLRDLAIMHDSFLNAGFTGEKIYVPMSTLDAQLDLYQAPRYFDVLSLDPEGMQTEILYSFDIKYWKPKMIIVETHKKHKLEKMRYQYELINDFLTLYKYKELYSDDINSIYVR